jgi:hypothetical protein
MCLENYGIDPCYCFSTPGLTWQAGLKFTGVHLKYYKEETYDQLLFYEKGVRGGFSSALGKRKVEVYNDNTRKASNIKPTDINSLCEEAIKNKDIGNVNKLAINRDQWIHKNKNNILVYYDANSLYPTGMVQALPTGEMWWSTNLIYERTNDVEYKEDRYIFTHYTYNYDPVTGGYTSTPHYKFNYNNEYSLGYVYEVDLTYPDEIKEMTRYYPFCPEKLEVPDEWLSKWQREHKPPKYKSGEKLVCTQFDKYNYIIDGRMLDWYLDHGMILTKIHKKLVYKKSFWLKSYIEFNIMKRTEAKNKTPEDKFGVFFYKLMNNAFYGKTLENVRKRQNIEIVNNGERFKLLSSKPTFKGYTHLTEDQNLGGEVCAMHMSKTSIKYDKFNYVGFTILELAKLTMYEFVYDVLWKTYGDKFKIHYTDTDSVFIEIEDDDIDKIKDCLHDTELGKFKDELVAKKKFITKAAFMKSKMYMYETVSNDPKEKNEPCKKIKGVSESAHRKITFDDFNDALLDDKIIYTDSWHIHSVKHNIMLEKRTKKTLDNYFDKAYLLDDGIEMVPYGHPLHWKKYYDQRSDITSSLSLFKAI